MGYGFSTPEGSLACFSVDTMEEAKALVVLSCPTTYDGEYYARELAEDQTLENLQKFGDRLAQNYERMKARRSQ